MIETKESLVEFAAPRLTDESATAISQELQATFDQGIKPWADALDSTAKEIVDLLPDDIDFTQSEADFWAKEPDQLTKVSMGIAQQIGGAVFSGLAIRIGQAYYKRQTEGAEAA